MFRPDLVNRGLTLYLGAFLEAFWYVLALGSFACYEGFRILRDHDREAAEVLVAGLMLGWTAHILWRVLA